MMPMRYGNVWYDVVYSAVQCCMVWCGMVYCVLMAASHALQHVCTCHPAYASVCVRTPIAQHGVSDYTRAPCQSSFSKNCSSSQHTCTGSYWGTTLPWRAREIRSGAVLIWAKHITLCSVANGVCAPVFRNIHTHAICVICRAHRGSDRPRSRLPRIRRASLST